MKSKNQSVLKNSAYLGFRWNKSSLFFLIMMLGILSIGCKKESCDCNDNSQYYVKYEINSSTIYYGGKLNVELKNESNITKTYTINQRELWETIIGPVDHGFSANLKVSAIGETYNHLQLYPSIYVSKDNGPFTLENSDNSDHFRDVVEINYTIE